MQKEGRAPPHDILVTNPPFSADHIMRALRYAGKHWDGSENATSAGVMVTCKASTMAREGAHGPNTIRVRGKDKSG